MDKTVTTIVKDGGKCVIYNDDGIFCSWSEVKDFNFNLIKEVKENAKGIVLLAPVEEVRAFNGADAKITDHRAWTISKDLIWILYGKLEPRASEEEGVNFLKSLII